MRSEGIEPNQPVLQTFQSSESLSTSPHGTPWPKNSTASTDESLVVEDLSDNAVADDNAAGNTVAPAEDAAEEQAAPEVAVVESQPAFTRETPTLNADGLPEGWSVRLGAFSDASNASNLLQRLQDSGYKAYSRTANNDQGELTVIYVGPWLERAMADDYLDELRAQFQLSGMVVRYELQQL